MSTEDQGAVPKRGTQQDWGKGSLVEQHKTLPPDAKYISYECDFRNKLGEKCKHKTAIESRKKADNDLYEHWTLYHKTEYEDMQSEADRERMEAEQAHEISLEKQKME